MKNKTIRKIFISFLIMISLIYIIIPYQSTNLNSTSYTDIDKYITSKMEELRIPGISLGLINKDDIYLNGYGRSDSSGTPITADTPFILGSTTKSITAVAVMQLVEQGKIDLDQTVKTYFPDFRFKNINESNKITIRQLLNQTSGIAGSTGGSDYLDEENTGKDFVINLANDNLSSHPGESYEYAEANFIILGEIISAVSSQSYANYIEEHIFKPLKMNNSFTDKNTAQKSGLASGNITWFGFPVETDLPYPKQYTSASALISSAEDLTHYMQFYIDKGIYNDETILSSQSINEIINPSVTLLQPAGYSYGMGWFVQNNLIIHDGRPTNYYSVILIEPDSKVGVALLANANNRLITAEYLMPVAFEIVNKLKGESYVTGGFGFRQVYKVIDLLLLWLLTLLIFRIIKTIKSFPKKISGKLNFYFYLKNFLSDMIFIVLTVFSLVYLLYSYGVSIRIAYLGQPDLVLSLLILIILPSINITTKIILLLKKQHLSHKTT